MQKRHRLVCCFSIPLFLLITGCSKPILKMPKSLPPIVKEYKHITLYGNYARMVNTGLYLNEGDIFSILATGSVDLWSVGAPADFEYHDVRPEHGWPFMARIGKGVGKNFCFPPLWNWNGTTQFLTLPPDQKETLIWYGEVPENAPINSIARLVVYYDDSFVPQNWWIKIIPGSELTINSSIVE